MPTFADEVQEALNGSGVAPGDWWVEMEEVQEDSLELHFRSTTNAARRTAIFLDRGCDLSCLPAAVAVQVFAVTG